MRAARWTRRLGLDVARATKNNPRYKRDGSGLLQCYGTPWYLVHELEREEGRAFDLDCCAEKWSAKAATFLTKKDDALISRWDRLTWCNPPWAIQGVFLRRAAHLAEEDGITVHCLVLASTSANYWLPTVFGKGTCDFFEGRISFLHPTTHKPVKGFDRANALVSFGPDHRGGVVRVRAATTGKVIRTVSR